MGGRDILKGPIGGVVLSEMKQVKGVGKVHNGSDDVN